MEPGFLRLHRSGELKRRAEEFYKHLSECRLCPRKCGVNRLAGKTGFCQAGTQARIFSSQPHFGEEPPLTGTKGSGVIFFSLCTGGCIYCQNWPMSHEGGGEELLVPQLSGIMLLLKKSGCHNLNLVSPTPWLPQIICALALAAEDGFDLPLVFNTSGYESIETLRMLEGMADIYLADTRYGEDGAAEKYSGMKNYVKINRAALREMHRQVGSLRCEGGIARRGLIVRHLVLPNNLAGTKEALRFLREEVSPEVHLSLMSQYYPFFRAYEDPLLNRPITHEEYREACRILFESGLENGWLQEEMDEATRKRFAGEQFAPLKSVSGVNAENSAA